MDWKTDATDNETEMEPYSSFQSNKSGGWMDRMELPIILIGAGLLALVILFVLFIPKKNEFTADDYKHLVSRLDQLESRLDDLDGGDVDLREFDPAQNPVQYQQVINWIKSNAEVISETISKLDALEAKVETLKLPETAQAAKASAPAPSVVKKQALPVPAAPATKRAAVESEAVAKSQPVKTPPPAPKAPRPVPEKEPSTGLASPKTPETASKAMIPEKPAVAPPVPAAPKPAVEKPETVRYVFHRVEKGETLYRISRNYNTTVEKLQELNKMKKDDLLIHAGQELIVRAEKQ